MSAGPRIAFVGAGQMGLPMVLRLVTAGEQVTVYARRSQVRDQCSALGAASTAAVGEAVRDADVVIVGLYSDAQVRELALRPGGFLDAMPPGSLLVVHTTGSPTTTRTLSDRGAARGVRVVEAPVSGSATDIAEGRLTVLLGGDPADLDDARRVVAAYGDPVLTIGPLGGALVVKLLNNALLAAQLQLAGEVERIAAAFGVDMPQAASAIQRSSGASYAMGLVQRFGSLAELAAAAGHFLQKDVATVEQVAAELGLELGVLGRVNREGPLTFAGRSAEDREDGGGG